MSVKNLLNLTSAANNIPKASPKIMSSLMSSFFKQINKIFYKKHQWKPFKSGPFRSLQKLSSMPENCCQINDPCSSFPLLPNQFQVTLEQIKFKIWLWDSNLLLMICTTFIFAETVVSEIHQYLETPPTYDRQHSLTSAVFTTISKDLKLYRDQIWNNKIKQKSSG